MVDLSERIPASWLRPGGVVRLTDVHVNGVRAGVIDLGVLSPQIVEGAWKRLSKARSQCKTGRKQWSCRSVERFLRQYPSSPQAKEAEAMLEDFAHRLEEHAWQRANIKRCKKAKASSDCSGLKRYLRYYDEAHRPATRFKRHHPRRLPAPDHERTKKRVRQARHVLTQVQPKLERLAKHEDAREKKDGASAGEARSSARATCDPETQT